MQVDYSKIKQELLNQIGKQDFWTGTIKYSDSDQNGSLSCTVIISRNATGDIEKMIPVYWDWKSDENPEGFSWLEFNNYLFNR